MLHAREDGFVVLVAEPLQTGEDGGGVLSGAEGGIVVQEALAGLKHQQLVFVVHDGEVERVTRLVATVPEVGHTTHVRVSRGVDGCDEPLGARLGGVGHRLGDVLFGVGLTVAVGVVVGFHPVVEFKFHRMANLVLNEYLDRLLVGRRLVRIINRDNLLALWMRGVHEEGAAPFAVGLLYVVGVALVVGLNLVGEAVRHVDGREVNRDEERPVVVGGVPCRCLDVAVSRNANVKGAVFGGVIGVLEPHGTHEVQLLSGSDPRAVLDVQRGQLAVVVANVEPAQAEGAVHAQALIGGQRFRGEACRAAVVKATDAEAHVVLIGQFAGDEELPVDFKNTVALDRIRGRIDLDVLRRVVGVGEHVAVLPGDHGPVGGAAGGHEG